jgi:hypothetical protein
MTRLEAEGLRIALSVMAGLVPAIHAAPFPADRKRCGGWTTWMTGTSPVMTGAAVVIRAKRAFADRCGIKESIV